MPGHPLRTLRELRWPSSVVIVSEEITCPASLCPEATAVPFVSMRASTVRVVNTHGTQVVDFWALRADRPEIAMSMQHSRIRWRHLRPHPGDEMLDEERSVILTFVEDTSPGVHDTVIAACDPFRYATTRRTTRPPLVLRQLCRGTGRRCRDEKRTRAGATEPVHEHPVGSRRQHHLRTDGVGTR